MRGKRGHWCECLDAQPANCGPRAESEHALLCRYSGREAPGVPRGGRMRAAADSDGHAAEKPTPNTQHSPPAQARRPSASRPGPLGPTGNSWWVRVGGGNAETRPGREKETTVGCVLKKNHSPLFYIALFITHPASAPPAAAGWHWQTVPTLVWAAWMAAAQRREAGPLSATARPSCRQTAGGSCRHPDV